MSLHLGDWADGTAFSMRQLEAFCQRPLSKPGCCMAIPARPFSPLFKTLELELISIDLPAEAHRTVMDDQQYVQVAIASDGLTIGSAVPNSLRARWTLRLGNALDVLPKILEEVKPITMSIHYSLHTYDHMTAEFRPWI